MAKSPTVYPCLKYADAPAAIAWLETAFGFAPKMVVPGESDTVMHAELTKDNGMLMCGSAGKPDPANPWSDAPFGIYVRVDDVDAHYARAKAAGAEIVIEPKDKPYGSRDYSVRDLEGRLWSFGDYDPFADA